MPRNTSLVLALGLVAPAARRRHRRQLQRPGLSQRGVSTPAMVFPAGQAARVPGVTTTDGTSTAASRRTARSSAIPTTQTFHSWSGWAYSNVNDPTTTGPTPFLGDYDHQFAAITGTAPGGSGNYGISSGTGAAINLPAGTSPVSFEVTNSTYSYLSMTHGDGFAKQFTTGDFFELKIFGFTGLERRRHAGRRG